MSCGQIALERAGIKVDNYYASEIDKWAIKIAQKNYPDTIQLGDIKEIDDEMLDNLPKIDLVIGGTPCQNLSSVNVGNRVGLEGSKSRLFYEYVRILKCLKKKNPDIIFLLENVGSAKNSDIEIINNTLGVEGIYFNSKLLSAQHRNRIYWTNLDVDVPSQRKELYMQDVLEEKVKDKYYLSEKMYKCVMSEGTGGWQSGKMEINLEIARPLLATMHKMHRADTDNYISTEYQPEGKTNVRRLTPTECERLQTVSEGYTKGVSDTQRYRMLGNGWTVDVIAHIFKGIKEGTN